MRGFTLIEIIVAMTIFSIAVGAISSLFVMSLRGQRNVIAQQNLADNTRFALEHMSRQIRMAQRDESGSCTGTAKSTYDIGGASLTFVDYTSNCLTYALSGGKIRMRPDTFKAFLDLTSDDIQVSSLNFDVNGRTAEDGEQPRVTISVNAQDANLNTAEILLQTTVSNRNVDVP